MKAEKRETIEHGQSEIRRAKHVMKHVEHMGPALRGWLLARLSAEECSSDTLYKLRRQGYR